MTIHNPKDILGLGNLSFNINYVCAINYRNGALRVEFKKMSYESQVCTEVDYHVFKKKFDARVNEIWEESLSIEGLFDEN